MAIGIERLVEEAVDIRRWTGTDAGPQGDSWQWVLVGVLAFLAVGMIIVAVIMLWTRSSR